MDAWRIVKAKHGDDAFSGEGAFRYGGRWNPAGTRLVYVSASLSLATLEILVHLRPGAPFAFGTFRIHFDDSLLERLDPSDLPDEWREEPPSPSTQSIGDAWARSAHSAVLAVPSAVIPEERNFLLNPAHPDFSKITIDPMRPFALDRRLLDATD